MIKKILIVVSILLIGWFVWGKLQAKPTESFVSKAIRPTYGTLRSVISTTGTVEPQNRLEIKPQINGRLESVLVREGDLVKKGQIIAWMSSTERAALLDTAQTQDQESVKYWSSVYKPTPLISPINGKVIVQEIRPGQTIGTDTAVLVLSDKLIVKAQVDETDISRVKVGQKVEISLDAYPDNIFQGTVSHVAYESTLVSNVIIYEVTITPLSTPAIFRSGMGTNVTIIEKERQNVLTLPSEAITKTNQQATVMVEEKGTIKPQPITVGMSDENNTEILSGITAETTVMIQTKEYKVSSQKKATSPFMPSRRPGSSGGNR
jgi:macrolide-specific efflux system membrane fusion protein